MSQPEAPARRPAGPPPDRYGRRDPVADRRRTMAVGATLMALLLAWAVWAGLRQARQDVRWAGGTFAVVDDGHATLELLVTMDPGRTAVCTVRMLNSGLTEVGRLDVPVGPGSERTVRAVATVPTFETAASGRIRACAIR